MWIAWYPVILRKKKEDSKNFSFHLTKFEFTMGNCCSGSDDIKSANDGLNNKFDKRFNDKFNDNLNEREIDSKKYGDENPRPMIFALMRNGHEVIRGAMEDISEEIATQTSKGDYADADKIIEMWNDLHAWEGMHKTMEEGKGVKGSPKTSPVGLFELLDRKYDGIATKNGLLDAHDELDDLEDAMHNACHLKDMWRIRRAWKNFEEVNSAHLKKEESIMMAKVTEMAKSGENLKDMMRNEIFALIANSPDLKFFIQFANRILDTHPGGMPRARVFDHALYAIATPQEWTTWQTWIEASLTKARYAEVRAAIYPEEESPPVPEHSRYLEEGSDYEANC
mmetsp:Transcript_16740/g.24751  ORF Transcript_16740/g.24751 Transcript_16740/m.24751 type:complete len:338 (-) Transcript_16740:84-1097(-)